ncbi:MAG TPA: hypothetical protein VML75_24935 [Kofleriaceae bacterium]|nr:hypothetical protein [Kofleriaceae bacterium]
MGRTWWHNAIIVASILVIFGVGVTAIWGPSLRSWFDSATQKDPAPEPPAAPAGPGGGML